MSTLFKPRARFFRMNLKTLLVRVELLCQDLPIKAARIERIDFLTGPCMRN